jgi:hypothetical protein
MDASEISKSNVQDSLESILKGRSIWNCDCGVTHQEISYSEIEYIEILSLPKKLAVGVKLLEISVLDWHESTTVNYLFLGRWSDLTYFLIKL